MMSSTCTKYYHKITADYKLGTIVKGLNLKSEKDDKYTTFNIRCDPRINSHIDNFYFRIFFENKLFNHISKINSIDMLIEKIMIKSYGNLSQCIVQHEQQQMYIPKLKDIGSKFINVHTLSDKNYRKKLPWFHIPTLHFNGHSQDIIIDHTNIIKNFRIMLADYLCSSKLFKMLPKEIIIYEILSYVDILFDISLTLCQSIFNVIDSAHAIIFDQSLANLKHKQTIFFESSTTVVDENITRINIYDRTNNFDYTKIIIQLLSEKNIRIQKIWIELDNKNIYELSREHATLYNLLFETYTGLYLINVTNIMEYIKSTTYSISANVTELYTNLKKINKGSLINNNDNIILFKLEIIIMFESNYNDVVNIYVE